MTGERARKEERKEETGKGGSEKKIVSHHAKKHIHKDEYTH